MKTFCDTLQDTISEGFGGPNWELWNAYRVLITSEVYCEISAQRKTYAVYNPDMRQFGIFGSLKAARAEAIDCAGDRNAHYILFSGNIHLCDYLLICGRWVRIKVGAK
jgi:hypothetical protein